MRCAAVGIALAIFAHSCRRPEAPQPRQATTNEEAKVESHRLAAERVVYLRGEITDDLATEVIAKLLFLEAGDPFKPITLKVDSPGGSVTAGLAIYDTMQQLKAHVRTHCEKEAGSMAAVLLASGSAGERSAARSCRVLLHELAFDDAGVRSTELLAFAKLKIKIVELLSHHTGRSPDEVWAQMRTAQSMDTAQAKAFGVIDEINR